MNGPMNNFLKSILMFIPFAAISYLALLLLWGSGLIPEIARTNLKYSIASFGHTYSRLKEVKTKSDVDVLFLGSSHAYRGFDTRYYDSLGLRSFNLGSSSQTPTQTRVLLERYLNQLDPRLVIYEVYPVTFSIDGVESSLDIIANDRNDVHSLQMALKMNHANVWNTLFYGVTRDRLGLNASVKQPEGLGADTYISGGYVAKEMKYFKQGEYPQSEWEFNDDQFIEFEQILSMIRKRKMKVILVNAPVTPSYYISHTNNSQFDSLMTSYGEYYNFNELMTLNDTLHFYDSHHLNQDGVRLFNQRLIDIFLEKGAFGL